MTRPLDPEALRKALQAPADPAGPVDIGLILARGRRLRWRRRFAMAAGGVCAALAVAGAAASIARVTGPPGPARLPLGPARPRPAAASPPATASPVPRRTLPPAPSTGHATSAWPTPVPTRPAAITPAPARLPPAGPSPSSTASIPAPVRSG